jgi:hypothetical protein
MWRKNVFSHIRDQMKGGSQQLDDKYRGTAAVLVKAKTYKYPNTAYNDIVCIAIATMDRVCTISSTVQYRNTHTFITHMTIMQHNSVRTWAGGKRIYHHVAIEVKARRMSFKMLPQSVSTKKYKQETYYTTTS